MKYEVYRMGSWTTRVLTDGTAVAVFYGDDAEARAREYADWKNTQEEMGKPSEWTFTDKQVSEEVALSVAADRAAKDNTFYTEKKKPA